MSYSVKEVWATIDKEGDYVDVFRSKLDADRALAYEVSRDPHSRLIRVERGWVVVDNETGIVPYNTKRWYWDEYDARNAMHDLDQAATPEDIKTLKDFARTRGAYIGGDLRPEVLAMIRQNYPIGTLLKIQALDIDNKVLRDAIVGETVLLTGIQENGSFDVSASTPLWGENKEFSIPFGKAIYQKVRP